MRRLNGIWFLGAAVWFFDAALSLHHRVLGRGLLEAAIAAGFLILGMLFRRQAQRRPGSDSPRLRQ